MRLGIMLAGYWFWTVVRGGLVVAFAFVETDLLRHGLAGILGSAVLIPFWLVFPRTTGMLGIRGTRILLPMAAAVFAPFTILALALAPQYLGISGQWLILAAALLMLAATEEIVCRGFILDLLSFSGNRYTGLFLSSAIFALFHIWNFHASVAGILNILLAGVLFGLLRFTSRGLVYPVLVHWLWNLVTGMVFGWSVSGHRMLPSLLRCAKAPPWGSFGPEESLLMTAVMLGGSVILALHLRGSAYHSGEPADRSTSSPS